MSATGQKRTYTPDFLMSAKCHKRTWGEATRELTPEPFAKARVDIPGTATPDPIPERNLAVCGKGHSVR